jgi:Reverse transcriptase (RNA-dependent DNA polymerase)
MVITTDLSYQLRRMFELDDYEPYTEGNKDECESHYLQNTKRLANGKFVVKIPFKNNNVDIGETKKRAIARLLQVEKSLEKDNDMRNEYHKFMDEYIKLGHMECCKPTTDQAYYIPHHAVLKQDSITTKLRVVFDASAKSTNGKSLNDNMLVGSNLQDKLSEILVRWRKHKIVYTADIEKMYRQIAVAEEDQKFQKILWRSDSKGPIKEYQLKTITYGTAAAPFLAIRTLIQLATEEEKRLPIASVAAKKDFYVDDFMSGCENTEIAEKTINEIINLFKSGGMTIRKWASNNKEILKKLPEELKLTTLVEINQEEVKTFGIFWNPVNVSFSFKVKPKDN